jgi:EAL domain-containing protein (putative c-di-GMP-specific phosphodiesterase class I)/GGDEF domain-containing protein
MSPAQWWLLVVHLGIAGSMATIGSLYIQWWWQDRTERTLSYTGVLCWSVCLVLLLGAFGFAYPEPAVWALIVPVRAVLLGVVIAMFLKTLSTMVELPRVRLAIAASFGLPVAFAVIGLTSELAYSSSEQSPFPDFRPVGNIFVGLSLLIFIGYSVMAIKRLNSARAWQLGATVFASFACMVISTSTGRTILSEAMTTLWTTPIAILMSMWCSSRVLTLQGSLQSAVAGRQQAETAAAYQSKHDKLTGLPNEASATEALQTMIDSAAPAEPVMAAVFQVHGLDETRTLSGISAVHGLIQAIAEHLGSLLATGVEIGLLAESTFLVSTPRRRRVPHTQLEAEVEGTIRVLRQSAALPSGLSVVAGIAVCTESTTADDLIQHARIAVTAAEQAGRATQVFRPEMREGIVRRARTARLLTAAADRDEFELHYQPVIDVRSGRRVSVEALVRWRHHGRLHPPAEWIPIAEQIGLMPAIGLTVLQIAIRDQRRLGCPVAVNVSPRQLSDPLFPANVFAALQNSPPAALVLEVTESTMMEDPVRAIATLQALQAHGIRIALDDFGTQYSSLSRLSTLPIDIIKIDRSFVARVLSPDGLAMVTAIFAMSRALGKTTVAEGVETDGQFRALQGVGLELIQGFLTGRPVPLEDLVGPDGAQLSDRFRLPA